MGVEIISLDQEVLLHKTWDFSYNIFSLDMWKRLNLRLLRQKPWAASYIVIQLLKINWFIEYLSFVITTSAKVLFLFFISYYIIKPLFDALNLLTCFIL